MEFFRGQKLLGYWIFISYNANLLADRLKIECLKHSLGCCMPSAIGSGNASADRTCHFQAAARPLHSIGWIFLAKTVSLNSKLFFGGAPQLCVGAGQREPSHLQSCTTKTVVVSSGASIWNFVCFTLGLGSCTYGRGSSTPHTTHRGLLCIIIGNRRATPRTFHPIIGRNEY